MAVRSAIRSALRSSVYSGIADKFGGLSAYAIAGFDPAMVLDFTSEYYRKNRARTTFDSALTHSRAGNATMVDSDGLLKWAPHNLLTYSEQFDNAAWIKTGATIEPNTEVAPDGTLSASTITYSVSNGFARQGSAVSCQVGETYTGGFWAKAGTATSIRAFILFSSVALGGTTVEYELTSEWSFVSASNTVPAGTPDSPRLRILASETGTVHIWGAQLYRSDLGGMVNNPDTGDSYVPTTSAARYLPRRGNHIYNGSSWVNAGMALESEARTNLALWSSDLSNGVWTGGGATTITASGDTARVQWSSATTSTGTIQQVVSGTFESQYNVTSMQIRSYNGGDDQSFRLKCTHGGVLAYFSDDLIATSEWRDFYFAASFGATVGASIITGVLVDTANSDADIEIRRVQVEADVSTPSSYIPTAGSTVTRAAETLTVAAADMPYDSTNMSIQIDGTMTGGTSTLARWYADASNYITLDAASSAFTFSQDAAGTLDTVTGGSFTSGVDVSFNIASRNGSTFINGAVDGTALTENATPVALPDLSVTNFQIGSTFMGNVGKVRAWNKDLGDTGIAESTS